MAGGGAGGTVRLDGFLGAAPRVEVKSTTELRTLKDLRGWR
jgi:hypothetical protein